MPDLIRNRILAIDFTGGVKGASGKTRPNMEIQMQVCDSKGNVVPDSLSHGETVVCSRDAASLSITDIENPSIDRPGLESTYRSVVHYHVGKIQWNEVIKVSVKTEHFSGSHLRFTFRHCGRNDVKERSLPFAMSFLKLVNNFDGTALKDGPHDLCVYKIEKTGRDFENAKYLALEEYRTNAESLEKKQVTKDYG